MHRATCLLVAVLLIVAALPVLGVSATARTHPIEGNVPVDTFISPSNAYAPVRAGGGTLVWLSMESEMDVHGYVPSEIRGVRLPDRQPFVIAELGVTEFGAGNLPLDVDGDIVVWRDEREPNVIRAHVISTGETFVVAELPTDPIERVTDLAVSSNWVIWTSQTATDVWVRARNIATTDEPLTLATGVVTEEGFAQLGDVETDAGWAVWGEQAVNQSWETFVAVDLTEPGELVRIDNRDTGGYGRTALADGMFVFAADESRIDPADPDAIVAPIAVLNLATMEERVLELRYSEEIEGPYPNVGPLVGFDGRYIFQSLQLSIPTSNPGLRQVVAYDLATDSVFPVIRDHYVLAGSDDGVLYWETGRGQISIYAEQLADHLPTARVEYEHEPEPDALYFHETGHTLSGTFRDYWDTNGGLPVFGYPLTEQYQERNADLAAFFTVQYLERERFEYHPENAGTPYEVLLGRLGAELLVMQGRDWTEFPTADPASPNYFAETGHAIASEFAGYWHSNGLELGAPGVTYEESVALFGYPLSEPMIETNADGDTVLTQYFERAVFEFHPDNDDPYKVLLRRLGAEALVARGWLPAPPSPDEDRIAYTAPVDGSADIFVMSDDGSHRTNLTNHPAADWQPVWSPDGTQLVFLSDRGEATAIYVMDADGSDGTQPRLLVDLPASSDQLFSTAWSPNGEEIAYSMDGDIYVIGLASGEPRNVTNSPEPDWDPAWSPDGERIAYTSQSPAEGNADRPREVIHVIDISGTDDAALTLDLYIARHPKWSPDGSKIAFEFSDDKMFGYSNSVNVMDSDGSNQAPLASCGDSSGCFGWDWSPDGEHIVLARDPSRYTGGDDQLIVAAVDGSSEAVIAEGEFYAWPDWSPDGSRIVFFSVEQSIWTIAADGSDLRRIADAWFDSYPVWAP